MGARWWHQALVEESKQVSRRQALVGMAVFGGALAAMAAGGAAIYTLVKPDPPEPVDVAKRSSLLMQQQYGWDFGARGRPLVFDGVVQQPFSRAELRQLGAVLAASSTNAKYQVGTLVTSLLAQPALALPDPGDGGGQPDAGAFRVLADVVVPIHTPAMEKAYKAGEAVARSTAGAQGVALLADLPGPEAVAFAAGAASAYEPVLLLDNWPHPQGVVPSHLTLAALAYYQPRFARTRASRTATRPVFVLDRARLNAYSEQGDRFDNRYLARVPPLSALAKDGVRTLLYVVGSPADLPEPADLNAVLGASEPGLAVRAVTLADFPATANSTAVHYGGAPSGDAAFAAHYGIGGAPRPARVAASNAHAWEFGPRAVQPPAELGFVPVLVTRRTGTILMAALDRRGSMNRFSGGWNG